MAQSTTAPQLLVNILDKLQNLSVKPSYQNSGQKRSQRHKSLS
ncbi:MAG: hypothetical protein V7K25_29365 [Nostoc sp.]